MTTLNKWVQKHRHDDLMAGLHDDIEKENARLRKEARKTGNYPFPLVLNETTCYVPKWVWCGWPVSRVLSRSARKDGAGMAIHLGPRLPAASRGLPGQRAKGCPGLSTLSSLSDLAPGGACRAAPVAGDAVGSYPTVSPLPEGLLARTLAVCSLWRFP